MSKQTRLFIVESPNKVRKIKSFLGDNFRVMASVGHICDLPKQDIGVDPPEFRPRYAVLEDKKSVVTKLRQAAKQCDTIYLGTDPDREGEAIAWHLMRVLGLKRGDPRVRRARFHQVTRAAITQAVSEAGQLDMKLVAAQEARRVIDRLVGYLVSPALGPGMSAGRVQSPAVRLVVEREREIRQFQPQPYYEVVANIDTPYPWKATWNWRPWARPEQTHFQDRKVCEEIAKTTQLTVVKVETGTRKKAPPPPLITSTLQQAASAKLGLAPGKTMKLAQNLFAAGYITYHRTDCPNLSDEAATRIRAYLAERGFALPPAPNRWRAKQSAQEAHEAIRPVDITQEDAGESEEERKLYRLIRARALASQMLPAVYDTISITLEGNVAVPLGDRPPAEFVAYGEMLTQQRGWLACYKDDDAEQTEPVPTNLKPGQTFACTCQVLDKKTKPPSRYTEASLIKKLEALGIGRPATYASIMETIKRRKYIEIKSRKIHATAKGEQLCDQLAKGGFCFFDFAYTSQMETRLDQIVEGKMRYLEVVTDVHTQLQQELGHLPESAKSSSQRKTWPSAGFDCPKCQTPIEDRDSFWRCPKCRKNLFKESYGHRFGPNEARQLFAGKQISCQLVSKQGRPYQGLLTLGSKGLKLEFPD